MSEPTEALGVAVLAEQIARQAHAGQLDKTGHDYIHHPRRVAGRLAAGGAAGEVVAAGWLHDVIEDCNWTAAGLLEAGVPARTVRIVQVLTRVDGAAEEYYAGIVAAGEDAVAVKLADIADNTDPERVAALDSATRDRLAAKYTKARASLGAR